MDRWAAIAEATGIPHQRVPSEAELKALWNKRLKVLTENEPPRENHPPWRVRVSEYAPCDTPDEDKNDGARNAGSNIPF